MTTQEYVSVDDDLSTCFTFEDTEHWREELRSLVCEECPSSPKRSAIEDSDSEDDPEPESSTIMRVLCFLSENGLLNFYPKVYKLQDTVFLFYWNL